MPSKFYSYRSTNQGPSSFLARVGLARRRLQKRYLCTELRSWRQDVTRNISARCLDRFLFFFWLGWSEGTLPISSAFQDRQSANNRIAVGWHGLMPGGHETEKTSIEDQVLKSNPILEAFGNVQVLGLDLWPQKRHPKLTTFRPAHSTLGLRPLFWGQDHPKRQFLSFREIHWYRAA